MRQEGRWGGGSWTGTDYIPDMRFIVTAVAFLALGAPVVGAASPISLTGPPLERARGLVEPSLYVIDAEFPPGAQSRRKSGLAFAVSPAGHLLTTDHLLDDDGLRATHIIASGPNGRRWPARILAVEPDNGSAVLSIADRGMPALQVAPDAGDEVGVFARTESGFTVVTGSVGPPERLRAPVDRIVTMLRLGINPGQSGGPVFDARGRVRGMVLGRLEPSGRGFMEPAPVLAAVLRRAGVENTEGPSGEAFRRGVVALEDLQPEAAAAHFRSAKGAYTAHAGADSGLEAAGELAAAEFRLDASAVDRGLLSAAGVIFAAMALWCAGALVRRRPRRIREAAPEEVDHEDWDSP